MMSVLMLVVLLVINLVFYAKISICTAFGMEISAEKGHIALFLVSSNAGYLISLGWGWEVGIKSAASLRHLYTQ